VPQAFFDRGHSASLDLADGDDIVHERHPISIREVGRTVPFSVLTRNLLAHTVAAPESGSFGIPIVD
jgi:hypothetical protein